MAEPNYYLEKLATEIQATGTTTARAPVRQSLTIAGRFRVYFAAHQYAPLVWSIATTGGGAARWGDDAMGFEIAVAELEITSGKVRTMYRPKATPDHEDGMPSAWIEVDGTLHLDPDSSTARIV